MGYDAILWDTSPIKLECLLSPHLSSSNIDAEPRWFLGSNGLSQPHTVFLRGLC